MPIWPLVANASRRPGPCIQIWLVLGVVVLAALRSWQAAAHGRSACSGISPNKDVWSSSVGEFAGSLSMRSESASGFAPRWRKATLQLSPCSSISLDLQDIKKLWNEWEIQSLILVSFGLQIFLFLAADIRRRSASRIPNSLLWLAYMSADSVAIFALGHLAVGASEPRHQLLLFWAPFLLLHLGGQDTITAFAMQDNELWRRHLLGLVTQAAVAGYVVSRSPWPDRRLLAATVLMFLCGFVKYAERTWCLFSARPEGLKKSSFESLQKYVKLAGKGRTIVSREGGTATGELKLRINKMLDAHGMPPPTVEADMSLVVSDALANDLNTVKGADTIPELLRDLKSKPDRIGAYHYVGALLSICYENLYTKGGHRGNLIHKLKGFLYYNTAKDKLWFFLYMLALLFPFLSILATLVLFIFTKKYQLYTSVDVIVSYILLIGAIILEVASLVMYILSHTASRVIHHLPWRRKLWSEVLAQYNLIEAYDIEAHTRVSSLPKWIHNLSGKLLGDKTVTHIKITEDLKKLVLDKLLDFGSDQQDWSFATYRGQLALGKWNISTPAAMHESIHNVDFPTSVLTWHIATDICYFRHDNQAAASDPKKEMARKLSNYIMYLIFKSGVMLTSNSRLVHTTTKDGIGKALEKKIHPSKKEIIKKFLAANQGPYQPGNNSAFGSSQQVTQLQLLHNNIKALDSLVLPCACAVANELDGIPGGDAGRWDLISEVWLEMLYYIAPRCGGDFHSQHLSTGGEFVTHVLVLMHQLGPFLPPPGGLAS